VRIFPLLALGGERSPYVDMAASAARASRHEAVIETVPYDFRRGGNQMMKIRRARG